MDAPTGTLLELLRKAAQSQEEMPLYKLGRLEGLLATRGGLATEAAERARAEGLLEVVRTEAKGKTTVEWVRITPSGRQFLVQHESPRRLLEDVLHALQLHRDGQPRWVEDLHAQLRALSHRLDQTLAEQQVKLADLHQRVAAALERLGHERVPIGLSLHSWQREVLTLLDERRQAGRVAETPLAELHGELKQKKHILAMGDYHQGLQQLATVGLVKLIEADGPLPELAEPEFILINGSKAYLAVALPT